MHRVKDPADPRRCTGAAPEGQCLNVAEPGCDRCRQIVEAIVAAGTTSAD